MTSTTLWSKVHRLICHRGFPGRQSARDPKERSTTDKTRQELRFYTILYGLAGIHISAALSPRCLVPLSCRMRWRGSALRCPSQTSRKYGIVLYLRWCVLWAVSRRQEKTNKAQYVLGVAEVCHGRGKSEEERGTRPTFLRFEVNFCTLVYTMCEAC